jgi:hypothetical protein
MSGMSYNALQGRFKDFEDFEGEINEKSFSKKYIFIEPDYGKVTSDYTCGNSMHPTDDVRRGERLIKKVYETIRNSPHWKDSLLLVTFDEHGGFYDHVSPPSATPPGDLMNENTRKHSFKFDQLGVRVPAIVVSPYIKKNIIDKTQYDHTSLLASLERLLSMSPLTERDKKANDFLHLLALDKPREDTPTTLPEAAQADESTKDFFCEDERENRAQTELKLTELKYAQKRGVYRDYKISENQPSDKQIMIAFSALRKVSHYENTRVKNKLIEQFKDIKTSVDADIFILESKLKVMDAKVINKTTKRKRRTENGRTT